MLGISERTKAEENNIFCEYSTDTLDARLASRYTLAAIHFETTAPNNSDAPIEPPSNPNQTNCGLKWLPGNQAPSPIEVIRSASEVTRGRENNILWSENGDYMFCALSTSDSEEIEALAEQSYLSMLAFIEAKGYPHILRAWNYFDRINQGEGDKERYRRFCVGRHKAFENTTNQAHLNVYPSASAVGCDGKGLFIYLVASKTPGAHFENPEQVSAFHYPRTYGPKSPSFARATLQRLSDTESRIYISGTASIKGHETQHPNQTNHQIDVSIDNIERLIKHVQSSAQPNSTASIEMLKVYVRHEHELDLIRTKVEAHFKGVPICYCRGDICRNDLNVEIDGICHLRANT
ncbi:MAG: hypothetical protein K6L76_05605 [Agarilytica sp.]